MLLLFIVCALLSVNAQNSVNRIIGGTDLGQSRTRVPYLVYVYGIGQCSGSIIDAHTVVTAAHCFAHDNGQPATHTSTIKISKDLRGRSIWETRTGKVIFHPSYSRSGGMADYDVAIVKVDRPMPIGSSEVNSVQLATSNPAVGTVGDASGYGVIEHSQTITSQTARLARNPVMACRRRSQRKVCTIGEEAGTNERSNTCVGDSGGPFVINSRLVGVLSQGSHHCGARGQAKDEAQYASVAGNIDFIRSNMHRGSVSTPVREPVQQPIRQPVQQPIRQPVQQPVQQPAPSASSQVVCGSPGTQFVHLYTGSDFRMIIARIASAGALEVIGGSSIGLQVRSCSSRKTYWVKKNEVSSCRRSCSTVGSSGAPPARQPAPPARQPVVPPPRQPSGRLPYPHQRQTNLHMRNPLRLSNGHTVCALGDLNLYQDSTFHRPFVGLVKRNGLKVIQSTWYWTLVEVCSDRRARGYVRTAQVDQCRLC